VTPRLTLREMTGADVDDMAALLGDERVMRYYPRPFTCSEARDWIARNQRRYRDVQCRAPA
jgi:RimJ/RimL family protein N-acetyltransferase